MTVYTETPRNVLRAAIADAETARLNLDDARSAARKAEDHVYDAKQRLAALREDSTGVDLPDNFISRLAGGDVGVLELAPGAECRARVDAAEQEAAVWRNVHEAATALVNDLERRLPILQHKVADAGRDVVRHSEAAARLMDGLAEMQVEVGRRRGALQFLLSKQLVADTAKESVARILRADFDSDPAIAWQSGLDALMRDADAVLPIGDVAIAVV